VSRDQALKRLAVQRSNQAFAAAADETLENRGSPSELERAAHRALARLEASHAARVAADEGSC
jgi:dephospho-CoA kinase